MTVQLDIISRGPDHSLAIWGPVVIDVWHGAVTVAEQRLVYDACESAVARGKGDALYLGVVERDSPPPNEQARSALARWSRDVVPKMSAAAIVAAGGGFRSAMVRGVGVALTALMPHRVPFKFFGTVEEGVIYLAPKLPATAGGTAAMREVVENLRAMPNPSAT